jgi:hypothetical protein
VAGDPHVVSVLVDQNLRGSLVESLPPKEWQGLQQYPNNNRSC